MEQEAHQLADALVMAGLEVSAIERLGQGVPPGVLVAEVLSVERHPHADRLLVVELSAGSRRYQVVTGAANFSAGDRVPLAPPGTELPVLGRRMEASEIRGVRSEGMMCSEQELGLGEDASGILTLPKDAPVGRPLVEALGLDETVIELEVYPNRPDCLGMVGIAREVSAVLGLPLRLPDTSEPAPAAIRQGEQGGTPDGAAGTGGELAADRLTSVQVEAPDLCPRYVARLIRGVQVGPSPAWIARRLRAAGMRPINNVVDVTNYVMLEMGQPLHAFDFERLDGRRVVVRRARAGERIRTLDGVDRELSPEMLVIAGAQRPEAVAGVLGGETAEVTETTQVLLLEAATFAPASIRRTARRLGIRTEASARFEKGLPPELAAPAARRALRLLQELAGGRVVPGEAGFSAGGERPRVIRLRPARVNELLGTRIPTERMVELLERLGLAVGEGAEGPEGAEGMGSAGGAQGARAPAAAQAEGGRSAGSVPPAAPAAPGLCVRIPYFRGDLLEEADLIEEIARLWGYDRIPTKLPAGPGRGGESGLMAMADRVRQVLAGLGLREVITYSFMDPAALDRLQLPADHPWRQAIRLLNPLAEDQSLLRTSLLPGLLEVAARNASRRESSVTIFEVGAVFHPRERPLQEQPDERPTVGILLWGEARARQWYEAARSVDFFDAKGLVEALLEWLRIPEAHVQAEVYPSTHPGRSASLWLAPGAGAQGGGGRVAGSGVSSGGAPGEEAANEEGAGAGRRWAGWVAELHPAVLEAFGLPGRAAWAELDLTALAEAAGEHVRVRPLPRYPAVTRDLALVVPSHVPAGRLEQVMREAGGPLVAQVRLFDVYEGEGVPEGHRSLAFSIAYRHPDRTLTDEEVNQIQSQMERALAAEGARLR